MTIHPSFSPSPLNVDDHRPGFRLLSQSTHPQGGHYVAVAVAAAHSSPAVLAGATPQTARTFASPQHAYDAFKADADIGDHRAWNICYALEDLIRD